MSSRSSPPVHLTSGSLGFRRGEGMRRVRFSPTADQDNVIMYINPDGYAEPSAQLTASGVARTTKRQATKAGRRQDLLRSKWGEMAYQVTKKQGHRAPTTLRSATKLRPRAKSTPSGRSGRRKAARKGKVSQGPPHANPVKWYVTRLQGNRQSATSVPCFVTGRLWSLRDKMLDTALG